MPINDLSELPEKEQCIRYLEAKRKPYTALSNWEDLELTFEFRCKYPDWNKKGKGCLPCVYFPIHDEGLWQARDYIFSRRDTFDIFDSILPKAIRTMEERASPLYGYYTVEIDGEGECEDLPPEIERQHSIEILRDAIGRGLPRPDVICEGRGGHYLTWYLDRVYSMTMPEQVNAYKRTLERICYHISGEPDIQNSVGQPAYSIAHADKGQTRPQSTLRPVGSFNWKEGRDNPHIIKLRKVTSRPTLYPRDKWSLEILPPLPEPKSYFPTKEQIESKPEGGWDWLKKERPGWKRWKMTAQTTEFLENGYFGRGWNAILFRAVSDLCWAGYTQKEAYDWLYSVAIGPTQKKEVYAAVYKGNRSTKFVWNTVPQNQDF